MPKKPTAPLKPLAPGSATSVRKTKREQMVAKRNGAKLPTHPGVTRKKVVDANGAPTTGRPSVEIDEVMLYEAAKTHASYDQLALIFGVGMMTIRNKYGHLVEKARAEQQKHLLSAQFATAINDRNPTMQIWLGKQYLGQKDVTRTEQTGADGGPIQNEHAVKAVAYIPENGRDGGMPSMGAIPPASSEPPGSE